MCRREGQKLFLKGLRCFTEKCAIEKRNFVPGQHGQARRPKMVGYGLATDDDVLHIITNQLRDELVGARGIKPLSWLMIGQAGRKPTL